MKKKISHNEKIFIAGSTGMAGSAIYRSLAKKGYGKKELGGSFLTPSRKELDLLDKKSVDIWFKTNNPTVTILAAAKVGGIFANKSNPTEFLLENINIQTNILKTRNMPNSISLVCGQCNFNIHGIIEKIINE